MAFYGAETIGNKFYVRRETLRLLLVVCTVLFWVHSAALRSTHTPSHISHGTDSIMAQYDTGRTESNSALRYHIWVSLFLIQNYPIEGNPRQCPFRGIFAEPLS
jgi:hypothetical protein